MIVADLRDLITAYYNHGFIKANLYIVTASFAKAMEKHRKMDARQKQTEKDTFVY